jgi:hypothetical protein
MRMDAKRRRMSGKTSKIKRILRRKEWEGGSVKECKESGKTVIIKYALVQGKGE